MPTPTTDLTDLHAYITPAMARALHHAPNVNEVFPAVVGGVLFHAEPGSIERRGDGADTRGNMGWFTSKATGRRYAVVYAHATQAIEIRERTQQGRVLHSITNATSNRDLAAIFAAL